MLFSNRSEKAEVLKKVPLFHNLNKHDLDSIARISDEIESKPGETLVKQGAPGREFILIAEGKVRVERNAKVLAHLGAGEFIGEMALLDGMPRSASVITEELSSLLVVHWSKFRPLLDEFPALQQAMLINLSLRVRALEETLLD